MLYRILHFVRPVTLFFCLVLVAPAAADVSVVAAGQQLLEGFVKSNAGGVIVVRAGGRDVSVRVPPGTTIGGRMKRRYGWPTVHEEAGEVRSTVPANRHFPNSLYRYPLPERWQRAPDPYGKAGGTRINGFSVDVLQPYLTAVTMRVSPDDKGEFVASDITYWPSIDPHRYIFDPQLPNVLLVGDSISMAYEPYLRSFLHGRANLWHAPGNNQDLKREVPPGYLRFQGDPGMGWDVIAFNGGIWNAENSADDYKERLRSNLDFYLRSGAEVVWITTTPIPYGFNLPAAPSQNSNEPALEANRWPEIRHEFEGAMQGPVPGRMRLQNEWAAEILKDHPLVRVVDLWRVVSNGEQEYDKFYEEWWYSRNVHFTGDANAPLARVVAQRIMAALGRDPADIAWTPDPTIPAIPDR